jgi:hypothetical protein
VYPEDTNALKGSVAMADQIRITVEHIANGKVVRTKVTLEHPVSKPRDISELGFNHQQQIDIIKGCQEEFLKAQSEFLEENIDRCPKCGSKLKYSGNVSSHFHSVFTDHKLPVKRKKCCNEKCNWTSVPSISSLFKTNSHPDLSKLQTETACNHPYREAQRIMNAFSYYSRKANNHERIYRTIEIVGDYISRHPITDIPENIAPAKELVCQVDGGYLRSNEEDQHGFEALASIVYSPENVIYQGGKPDNKEPSRGEIISRHCAASALDDDLATIRRQTLMAALKQGMTPETNVTALCDGASNCWNVIRELEGRCRSVEKILDWFHVAKRFQNVSLPEYLVERFDHIKWCIWHGQSEKGLGRFDEIINKTHPGKVKTRLIKLKRYLENNKGFLVNYEERYSAGRFISSSIAESTIETLINRRCKRKQHINWSRKGVHPLLQVRASCASNDWRCYGSAYVFNAMTQAAA